MSGVKFYPKRVIHKKSRKNFHPEVLSKIFCPKSMQFTLHHFIL